MVRRLTKVLLQQSLPAESGFFMEDKTKFELRALPIPNFLYKEKRLSVTALKVYCFIHAYTNPFFFSNEHLAEMFDCHYETISTAIGQLEETGYIKTEYIIKTGGGKTRLSVDAYPDKAKPLSRINNSEAPNKRNHLGKDIKDNNIKAKTFLKKENGRLDPDLQENLAAKQLRKLRPKTPFTNHSMQQTAVVKDLDPLTDEQIQEIANETGVSFTNANMTYLQIMYKIKSGEFKGNSVPYALRSWIVMGLQRGSIKKEEKYSITGD